MIRHFRFSVPVTCRTLLLTTLGLSVASPALANPSLLIDADTGAILSQEDATRPWYPASITKLMTVYVALNAVRQGKITLDSPLKVSARANRMPPSKMGFKPGSEVTLDNALKMLMVKSANDLAVVIAEGLSGSVENFADQMNTTGERLGLRESHFANPNGLPNPQHYSSARDFALIARALLHDFPEHTDLFSIGALSLNGRTIPNHNGLLGRYPGADGMKTGFTCAAGFNVVASATHNGRKLIAVILGESSAKARTDKAATLFDTGFATSGGSARLEALPAGQGAPPDMHKSACSRRTKDGGAWVGEIEDFAAPIVQVQGLFGSAQPAVENHISAMPRPVFDPIPVFVGRAANYAGLAYSASNPALKSMPAAANAYVPVEKPRPLAAVDPNDPDMPLKPDPSTKPLNLSGAENPAPIKIKPAKTTKPALIASAKVKTPQPNPAKIKLADKPKPGASKPNLTKPVPAKPPAVKTPPVNPKKLLPKKPPLPPQLPDDQN